jgi:hypothetical protein
MKKKILLLTAALLILLPIFSSSAVYASEIVANNNNNAQINTLDDVDFSLETPLNNVIREKRERGVGSHGERPKIYPAKLNQAQKKCLVAMGGTAISGLLSQKWFALPVSLATAWYTKCSKL